ncbi:MAG: hypothetical protein WCB92_32935 [Mycobacterium sp.]
MAVVARIRHPHDEWARVADEVSKVRHKFGHMLHLDETEGKYPHRTLHFTRLGGEGEQRSKRGDYSLGLSWRGDEWAQQVRRGDSVTEQELWQTLEKEYWLIQVSRAVRHLGGILEERPDLSDHHPITAPELVLTLAAARVGQPGGLGCVRPSVTPAISALTLLTYSRPSGGFDRSES